MFYQDARSKGLVAEVKKPKVATTNRIRVKDGTIYCSSKIIREVRQYLTRGNQCYLVLSGSYDDLIDELRKLCKTDEWQFSAGSREYLFPPIMRFSNSYY